MLWIRLFDKSLHNFNAMDELIQWNRFIIESINRNDQGNCQNIIDLSISD